MTIDASDIHGPFEELDAGKRASGFHTDGGEASSPEAALAAPGPVGARAGVNRAGMDTESRRRIGRNLRILYGDVLNLPLPDRFEVLLAELSAKPASREIS
ncbi:NepR family anti-sigma factor [Methylobacterium sp. 10]|uniref:NepR family anti-sigma factor n=1 Tax=Methylobacterium sp. 10 TaxID=1101191 RepID=UPI0004B3472E|nr:NepR family anti-sigma factor [Methylobacterium sp. 10]